MGSVERITRPTIFVLFVWGFFVHFFNHFSVSEHDGNCKNNIEKIQQVKNTWKIAKLD